MPFCVAHLAKKTIGFDRLRRQADSLGQKFSWTADTDLSSLAFKIVICYRMIANAWPTGPGVKI